MTITNKVSSKSVMAGNTPIADVVDAPTIGAATDLETGTSVTVAFTAAATGGAATSFGAISTPGSITGTSATSPITVTGLTSGTAYTFKTYGINSAGTWSNVLSASSNSVTPVVPTDYVSIASSSPTSSGTITFSSIPSTYKHLQIRVNAKVNSAGSSFIVRFNGDTANNYNWHSLAAASGSVFTGNSTPAGFINCTDSFSGAVGTYSNLMLIDVHDYQSTTKHKTARIFFGADNNTTTDGYVGFMSGLWRSTSAVTSIDVTAFSGNSFITGSTISLYGIKG